MAIDANQLAQLLSGLSGVAGQYTSGQNQNQALTGLFGNAGLAPQTVNGAAGTTTVGNGNVNTTLNPTLASAFGGAAGLSSDAFSKAGTTLNSGLPANVATANGQLQTSVNNNQAGYNSLMTAGQNTLNNGVTANATAAENNQLNQAQTSFDDVYNGSLKTIMAGLQPSQDQQVAANNDAQYARGQMGSSGGALQTAAMYKGFGQADLAAQQQAYTQALQQQQQNVNAATSYGNIGNNNLLTGTQLLQSAFGQFGMNQQNVQSQAGVAALPTSLAQGQATLGSTGVTAAGGVNTMGTTSANQALTAANESAQNGINASGKAGQLSQTQNSNGSTTLSSLLSSLSSGGSNSSLSGILSQIFGGSSGSIDLSGAASGDQLSADQLSQLFATGTQGTDLSGISYGGDAGTSNP